LRTLYKISDQVFVVGAVGRLVPVKRFDLLLKAFAIVVKKADQPVDLCIVGDGPERKNLERIASDLNITGHVNFVGAQNNVAEFYSFFDCLAISSDSEGLSMALLESIAAGLQVVTTGKDGRHDVIKNGQNGFVVPVGDIFQLSDCLCRLANQSTDRQSLLPRTYSVDVMSDRYESIYRVILKN
jgi:glycosyltransferase involved in cell wall biosynthesis